MGARGRSLAGWGRQRTGGRRAQPLRGPVQTQAAVRLKTPRVQRVERRAPVRAMVTRALAHIPHDQRFELLMRYPWSSALVCYGMAGALADVGVRDLACPPRPDIRLFGNGASLCRLWMPSAHALRKRLIESERRPEPSGCKRMLRAQSDRDPGHSSGGSGRNRLRLDVRSVNRQQGPTARCLRAVPKHTAWTQASRKARIGPARQRTGGPPQRWANDPRPLSGFGPDFSAIR